MFLICCDPLQRHKCVYDSRRHPRRNFRKVSKKVASESHGRLCEGSVVCINCLAKLRNRSGSPAETEHQPPAEQQEEATVGVDEHSSASEPESSPKTPTTSGSCPDVAESPQMTPTTASQSLEEVLPGLDVTPVRKRKYLPNVFTSVQKKCDFAWPNNINSYVCILSL